MIAGVRCRSLQRKPSRKVATAQCRSNTGPTAQKTLAPTHHHKEDIKMSGKTSNNEKVAQVIMDIKGTVILDVAQYDAMLEMQKIATDILEHEAQLTVKHLMPDDENNYRDYEYCRAESTDFVHPAVCDVRVRAACRRATMDEGIMRWLVKNKKAYFNPVSLEYHSASFDNDIDMREVDDRFRVLWYAEVKRQQQADLMREVNDEVQESNLHARDLGNKPSATEADDSNVEASDGNKLQADIESALRDNVE